MAGDRGRAPRHFSLVFSLPTLPHLRLPRRLVLDSSGRFPGLLVSEHLKVAKNSALWNGVREGLYEGRKRKGIRSPFVSAIFHPLIAVMGSLSVTIPKTNLCLKAFHHHHHRRQHHHHNQHNHRLTHHFNHHRHQSSPLPILALKIFLLPLGFQV